MNETIFLFQFVITAGFFFLAFSRPALMTALISLSLLVANFIVIEQISLFGLSTIGSELFISIGYIGLLVLQEIWGKAYAQYAILAAIGLVFAFVILSQLHLAYEPAIFDTFNTAYYEIFHLVPQIFLGSSFAFVASSLAGLAFFEKITKGAKKTSFPMRIAAAFIPTQLIDTSLFIIAGLYSVAHESLIFTFIGAMILKMLIFTLMLPLLSYIEKASLKNDFDYS